MADDASDISAFSVIVHFDPLMVAELAFGADHPHDIAERYGVDPEDYEQLAAQPWFEELVARKRTEFADNGIIFQAKAAMMAESLLTRLFQQSMAGVLPPPLTVEVAKQLTDIGRLKPQPLNTMPGANSGTGFAINIQVNGADVVRHDAPHLIVPAPALASNPSTGGNSVAAPPQVPDVASGGAAMSLDFATPKGVPPAGISNLKVPGFDVRHPGAASLTGGSAYTGAVPTLGLPPRSA